MAAVPGLLGLLSLVAVPGLTGVASLILLPVVSLGGELINALLLTGGIEPR